jgi:[acyl-carrier-protein] S-malonyltransferase
MILRDNSHVNLVDAPKNDAFRVTSSGNTRARVFLFPGQSSVDPEMIKRARALGPATAILIDRAAAVLGATAIDRYAGPRGAQLENNRDVQVAGFLATQMHLHSLCAAGVHTDHSLGLSLGEYSHLVHIGALTFEAALSLVDQRGRAYDESPSGVMITVLGATESEVASAVALANEHGTVVVSNYNTPTQHVIAGERAAVEWAAAYLEEEVCARCVETESRVPMHSPLLAPVVNAFRPSLRAAPWKASQHLYLPNVSGLTEAPTSADVYVERLAAHVTEPVRWRRSIENMAARFPEAWFIEVGPGSVVHNMLSRGWLDVRRARTDDPSGPDARAWFASTLERIRDDH